MVPCVGQGSAMAEMTLPRSGQTEAEPAAVKVVCGSDGGSRVRGVRKRDGHLVVGTAAFASHPKENVPARAVLQQERWPGRGHRALCGKDKGVSVSRG